jgi:UDP-N-acetylmuramate dehydrogenase
MQIQLNFSLKKYNTFAINAFAKYFSSFSTVEELLQLLDTKLQQSLFNTQPLILGGGSNILLTTDFDGLVLKNNIRGIENIREDKDHIYIRVGAGENWHRFVVHCIENNWAGVENLSLIPGNVGAAPMQNIGAYGVELMELFDELEAFHLEEKRNYMFRIKDCKFGYRESIFKNKYKDQFVILNVTLRLNKKPIYNTSYGAIKDELSRMKVKDLSIRVISQAVINIRSSKLPDPAVIGNAGSFFKNPSVPQSEFKTLQEKFPEIISYQNPDGTIKLAAGWLIEQCGWKGYRSGDAGCHANQALVLVNYGNAKGSEIYELSERILESVQKKFMVTLEREVNII